MNYIVKNLTNSSGLVFVNDPIEVIPILNVSLTGNVSITVGLTFLTLNNLLPSGPGFLYAFLSEKFLN